MLTFKYFIIGGGIAGTTATETIRRHDESGSMAIVSDEPHRLYSRIMLSKPNFFLEKIPFEQIWLKKESWYKENKIELIAGKKAAELDPAKKIVRLHDGQEVGYEKLLLALGGCPRLWPVPGADKNGIFYLRTLDDAKAVIGVVKTAKEALAIGGGFISFEMCEMLRMAGIAVTLILRESYYWEPILDQASGQIIEKALEKGGVKIIRNAEVAEIKGEETLTGAVLKNGTAIDCQMIIVGIGVFCEMEWLKSSGLKINRGILANEYLQTNLPDIWTAGDAAEFKDLVLGEQVQLGNWVNAQVQGRVAGANMTGRHDPFRMVSFYTTQGFGITIAFVGDVRPGQDRVVIPRGSADKGSYSRIIVKDGEVIGATLINRTPELSDISKIIEKDIKVSGKEKELADSNFDLKTLLR